jgi:AcrR family transcriptional regulator
MPEMYGFIPTMHLTAGLVKPATPPRRTSVRNRAHDGPTTVAEAEHLLLITEQAGAEAASVSVGPLLPERSAMTGTRRRVYEAALVLFAQRGYHGVSVREIAAEVGVRASSVYAHVPSKQHLLTDLVRLGHEEHRDQLHRALLDAGSDPGDQIKALTRAHVFLHATFPLLARVCNRELGSIAEEHRADVMAVRVDAERLFLQVIDRGRQLGAFRPESAVLAVAAIGAMGIRVAEWWHPDLGLPAEAVADAYAEFALRMVRTQDRDPG